MRTVLRWPAYSWEKAPLMCRLFGHKWDAGWWGHAPYLRLGSYQPIDNVGEAHMSLTCECRRCGTRASVAMIHASAVLRQVKSYQDRGIYLRRWRVKELEE